LNLARHPPGAIGAPRVLRVRKAGASGRRARGSTRRFSEPPSEISLVSGEFVSETCLRRRREVPERLARTGSDHARPPRPLWHPEPHIKSGDSSGPGSAAIGNRSQRPGPGAMADPPLLRDAAEASLDRYRAPSGWASDEHRRAARGRWSCLARGAGHTRRCRRCCRVGRGVWCGGRSSQDCLWLRPVVREKPS
jgi:hypothetical protein